MPYKFDQTNRDVAIVQPVPAIEQSVLEEQVPTPASTEVQPVPTPVPTPVRAPSVIQKIRKLKTARKRGVLAPISSLRYFGITLREPRTIQIIHPTPQAYSLV